MLTGLAVYLVGSHPNSPKNPHSAPASGGSNISDIRNNPPDEAYVLYGAMVGGPLVNDLFWDWRDDWVQTEVALDYNAMIPTLAAMSVSVTKGHGTTAHTDCIIAYQWVWRPVLRRRANWNILHSIWSTMR